MVIPLYYVAWREHLCLHHTPSACMHGCVCVCVFVSRLRARLLTCITTNVSVCVNLLVSPQTDVCACTCITTNGCVCTSLTEMSRLAFLFDVHSGPGTSVCLSLMYVYCNIFFFVYYLAIPTQLLPSHSTSVLLAHH